ncbi:MAG: imidazole glycerol phosphate synthase subunit HisH, partial [Rhodothermales bacterium]
RAPECAGGGHHRRCAETLIGSNVMIVIVDYKMGNLRSILNMLKKIGAPATITSDVEEIRSADRLILPGVGSFDHGMRNIRERGLLDVLNEKVLQKKTPVLGICLGMQLLSRRSEEGHLPGLGWIAADTIRFHFNGEQQDLKIPHMGWNTVEVARDDSLFQNLTGEDTRFYFVHSYHVVCEHEADVLARTNYGLPFVSSVQHGHILGTQFHPEKSHRYGMHLLKNFVEYA